MVVEYQMVFGGIHHSKVFFLKKRNFVYHKVTWEVKHEWEEPEKRLSPSSILKIMLG